MDKAKEEALALFGEMREATEEEKESVRKYIESISIKTGVNIFDLWGCDTSMPTDFY